MTIRTPNRTASTGVFHTGSPDYVDVSSATAESGMVTFYDKSVDDSWADGDSIVIVVHVDDSNYKVCAATWDETNKYLLLGANEEDVGTIADAAAVTVTATLSNSLLEDGLLTNYPDLSGLDQGGDARGFGALNLQTGRSTDDQVASGNFSIAAGRGSKASGSAAVAVGRYSEATGIEAFAVGKYAKAGGAQSIAWGKNSEAAGVRSLGIGECTSHGDDSIALGNDAFADDSIVAYGFFAINCDDRSDQDEKNMAGTQSAFATPPVDLGVPPDWQATTTYSHGQIVQPTTGGALQFRLVDTSDSGTLLHNTSTSEATEPEWPTYAGDFAWCSDSDDGQWISIDLTAGYETTVFPDWLEFHLTGISFICQDYAATTGVPTISIGTPASPTLILNAATVGITAVGQTYHFTLPNPCPCIPEGGQIIITLDGAATAGVMAGRFIFTGVFVATRSRT